MKALLKKIRFFLTAGKKYSIVIDRELIANSGPFTHREECPFAHAVRNALIADEVSVGLELATIRTGRTLYKGVLSKKFDQDAYNEVRSTGKPFKAILKVRKA